jgi:hypothetical protein
VVERRLLTSRSATTIAGIPAGVDVFDDSDPRRSLYRTTKPTLFTSAPAIAGRFAQNHLGPAVGFSAAAKHRLDEDDKGKETNRGDTNCGDGFEDLPVFSRPQ